MSQNDTAKDVAADPGAGQVLDAAQVEQVGGGSANCDVSAILNATDRLTAAYENLVDFTSHVIERVLSK